MKRKNKIISLATVAVLAAIALAAISWTYTRPAREKGYVIRYVVRAFFGLKDWGPGDSLSVKETKEWIRGEHSAFMDARREDIVTIMAKSQVDSIKRLARLIKQGKAEVVIDERTFRQKYVADYFWCTYHKNCCYRFKGYSLGHGTYCDYKRARTGMGIYREYNTTFSDLVDDIRLARYFYREGKKDADNPTIIKKKYKDDLREYHQYYFDDRREWREEKKEIRREICSSPDLFKSRKIGKVGWLCRATVRTDDGEEFTSWFVMNELRLFSYRVQPRLKSKHAKKAKPPKIDLYGVCSSKQDAEAFIKNAVIKDWRYYNSISKIVSLY